MPKRRDDIWEAADAIRQSVSQGEAVQAVAKRYGCSRETIRRLVAPALPPEEEAARRALHSERVRRWQDAHRDKVNAIQRAWRKRQKAAGIPYWKRRDGTPSADRRSHVSTKGRLQAAWRKDDDLPASVFAERFGVTEEMARKWILEARTRDERD